jgi:hypothetical protein
MKTIQLTKGFSTVVDDEDYERLSQHKWHVIPDPKNGNHYAARGHDTVLMHADIMGCAGVDHRDGDGLNNRRCNLRVATKSQNQANRRKLVKASSRFKGVTWNAKNKNWRARIGPKSAIDLGSYQFETEAALAYDRAALARWGEFARPNFERAHKGDRKTFLFVGFGRAGKDCAAEFLGRITQLRYAGSFSWAALPFMSDFLGVHPMLAWDLRHQNRQLWKDRLDFLRLGDETLLAEMALTTGEIAAGLRDKAELNAVKRKGLFDRIIWIDRPGNPKDPTVTFGPEDCHETIVNDGTLEQYHAKLFNWAVENRLPLKRTDEIYGEFAKKNIPNRN